MDCKKLLGFLFILLGIYLITRPLIEGYRDPIYLNRKKFSCDWYPRANGTIYGERSHIMSGYPYYDHAY